jgi:hypothetical protein
VVGKLRVEGPITADSLTQGFQGREAYKLTDYYCVTNGDDWAVISIRRGSGARLLVPVEDVEVLALPDETVHVVNPEVDTTNPTSMLEEAAKVDGDAKCVVVQGEFNHLSFVLRDGSEVCVKVIDVVPPHPSKVATLARRALDCYPIPILLEEQTIELAELAKDVDPEARLLFPCRASGLDLDREVEYLDEMPDLSQDDDVTLVGCNLSERVFRARYGSAPTPTITMCPLELVAGREEDCWTLVKCCKEKGPFGIHGRVVAIPWSATKGDTAAALEEIYDRVIEERLSGLRNGSCGCQSCRPEHL